MGSINHLISQYLRGATTVKKRRKN